jgi:serine/threonine protein kinase
MFLELSEAIRFHQISFSAEIISKTPAHSGFSLINNEQQTLRIYLQYKSLLELWLLRLSSLLNRVGFHEEFKMLGRIGKGSTSTVFKVERLADGKVLAAKVFLKSYLSEKVERKSSTSNEISLLRVMEHHNILKIHSVYESASCLYVITDLLEGGTLIERLNTSKNF